MLPAHLRRSAWIAALLATMTVAACASPQQGTTTAATENAGDGDAGGNTGGGGGELCSILSEDEVATIAGSAVTSAELTDGDCDYTIEEADLINVRYESSFDANLEAARMVCEDSEDLSGIGDQALWCPGLNVLYFNKGDRSVAVQLVYILSDPPRELKEIATDLATEIANGL